MIDYSLLQALAAVVTHQGFEKAAQKLFLTQSAVSRRIRQLEALLGEPVLIRTQPPQLTAKGTRLLNHLQQVMQLEASLGLEAALGITEQALTVRLATNADSLATWLPEALTLPLSESVPKHDPKYKPKSELEPATGAHLGTLLNFELVVEDQAVGLKRMKSGDVMVCICDSAEAVNGGRVSPLGSLRYRAVASPEFVRRYQLSSPAQLAHAPCLVFNQDDKLQHQYLSEVAGIMPTRLHVCPSSEGFLRSVHAGLGFGLLPELQFGDALASGALIDLTPGYQLDTPLYWHYWQTESPQLKTLRHHALNVARKRLIQSFAT